MRLGCRTPWQGTEGSCLSESLRTRGRTTAILGIRCDGWVARLVGFESLGREMGVRHAFLMAPSNACTETLIPEGMGYKDMMDRDENWDCE